jgi:hypothetical protein
MSPLITLCIRVEKAFPSDFPLVQNVRPPRIRQAKATLGSILLKEAYSDGRRSHSSLFHYE